MNKPGYKHTALGWIPEEWEVKTVGSAFQICNNLRFPISEDVRKLMPGEYPYYGPTKIQDYINEYRVEGKYALIGEDGDHFLKWRQLPMTLLAEGKFNVNNHAHLVRGEENLTEWFFYFFKHRELTPFLSRQGAGRYKLTKESLTKVPCLIPPLPEQHKIAILLSTWDAAIAAESALITALQSRHRALMQRLLSGRVRLKGFAGEWKEVRLGEVFTERNETNTANLPLLSIGERGVTYQSDSSKKDTSNEDKSKYRRICPGDIGYNTMRMWQGRSALSSLEGIVSPAYTIVTPVENQFGPFYATLFKQRHVVNRFFCHSQGLVEDTLNCKYKDFALVKVSIPEYDEQRAIAHILATSEREIAAHKSHLAVLQSQKKGLMQMLLTGKKRVKL